MTKLDWRRAKTIEPETFHNISFDPIKFMPVGKYAGKPWNKVPEDYLRWFIKNAKSVDGKIRKRAKHYLKKIEATKKNEED